MNETAGKTASCLSITEKRPHKPGGCVGIFFQLFDWNRRFAKKKLFSRKLLPPARAKQVSKKFGGDEKMPKTKLHLIADENSGGFPNMKKNNVNLEAKHEMRSPSLVARLMGLETMPTVGKEKPRKPSFSGSNDKTRTNEFVNGYVESDGDLSLNKGRGKIIEPRPQKIQKTTQFEKRTITRFGSEALHIKSVLSRSRKQHNHPKLLSPVKSPRSSTRSSRLIDAATRILEPRLQATSRAKCALTYSRQSHYVAHDEIMSPDMKKQPDYNLSVDEPLMGQNSCRSCGNLLDDVEHGQIFEDRPLVYSSPVEKVGEVESWQVEQNVPVPAQENNNRNIGSGSSGVFSSGSMMPSSQAQSRWHLPSNDEQSSFAYKQRTRTQTRMSLDKDRIPPRSKLTSLQSRRVSSAANGVSGAHKDFIALNRSLCGRPRPRSPAKVDNSASDVERHLQDEPSSHLSNPVRKRRTASVDSQVDSARFMGPTHGRQRNIRSEEARGRGMGRGYIKGKSTSNEGVGGRVIRNKESDVISFMFNSPMRHKSGIPSGVKVKKEEQMRKACEENVRVSKELPWRGDALGALLEEKLKELTSQEEEEFTSLSTPPKRSTAVILQELISALTVDHPVFQNKTKLEDASKVFANKGNHLSPGSVLEASFSNDSCISSSVDDSSGHRLNLDSTEYMRERLQPIEPEEDLSDSATSSSKRKASTNQMVLDLVNQISKLLYSINNNSLHLPGSKLTHAKDVILNAELLFGDMSLHYSNGSRDFLVSPFLLDELEILARAMWPNFNSLLGFEDRKEGDRLRGFLFDCLIECFDSKYGRYTNSGFKAWTRLPLRIKAEMLLREVGIEVIKWTHLVGMTPDELIECDMSYSLGKWTDFEIEAFETGAEIGSEILQILVDEVVADLWDEHRLVSF